MSEKKNDIAGRNGFKRFFSAHASEISIGSALLIICVVLFKVGLSPVAIFGLIIAWSIVDALLVSPLIYMTFLPKPLSAHIKRAEDLNAYEQKILEDQMNYDPRQEKLMHKYRDRKGEEYKGAADFWRKMNKDD